MRAHLRFLTMNVWARHGDWAARRQALATGLSRLDSDLVAFQETIVDESQDQVADLLPGYHVVHQSIGLVGDGTHHGASVASRWPIESVHEVDQHVTARTSDYSCGTVMAEVRAPDPVGPVLVVSHGPSWPWWSEAERELQALAAARRIEELTASRPMHVLVGGDFNGDPRTAAVRFWTGHQSLKGTSVAYRDAWESVHGDQPGATLDPRNPLTERDDRHLDRGRRIDYILVRAGDHGPTLRILDCVLAFAEPVTRTWASDHFGVVADLSADRSSVSA
jgi:endonuclease/exonuclease/phosphatase family metal-dependent hydrolase